MCASHNRRAVVKRVKCNLALTWHETCHVLNLFCRFRRVVRFNYTLNEFVHKMRFYAIVISSSQNKLNLWMLLLSTWLILHHQAPILLCACYVFGETNSTTRCNGTDWCGLGDCITSNAVCVRVLYATASKSVRLRWFVLDPHISLVSLFWWSLG